MKYAFHIVDVFQFDSRSAVNQLAVLPDAAGISTEGMQKIAREFNFVRNDLRPAEEGSCGTRVGCASFHLGRSSTSRGIPRSAQLVRL